MTIIISKPSIQKSEYSGSQSSGVLVTPRTRLMAIIDNWLENTNQGNRYRATDLSMMVIERVKSWGSDTSGETVWIGKSKSTKGIPMGMQIHRYGKSIQLTLVFSENVEKEKNCKFRPGHSFIFDGRVERLENDYPATIKCFANISYAEAKRIERLETYAQTCGTESRELLPFSIHPARVEGKFKIEVIHRCYQETLLEALKSGKWPINISQKNTQDKSEWEFSLEAMSHLFEIIKNMQIKTGWVEAELDPSKIILASDGEGGFCTILKKYTLGEHSDKPLPYFYPLKDLHKALVLAWEVLFGTALGKKPSRELCEQALKELVNISPKSAKIFEPCFGKKLWKGERTLFQSHLRKMIEGLESLTSAEELALRLQAAELDKRLEVYLLIEKSLKLCRTQLEKLKGQEERLDEDRDGYKLMLIEAGKILKLVAYEFREIFETISLANNDAIYETGLRERSGEEKSAKISIVANEKILSTISNLLIIQNKVSPKKASEIAQVIIKRLAGISLYVGKNFHKRFSKKDNKNGVTFVIDKQGAALRLELYGTILLGEGSYSKVKNSMVLEIDNLTGDFTTQASVIKRLKYMQRQGVRAEEQRVENQELNVKFKQGLKVQNEFSKLLGTERLAGFSFPQYPRFYLSQKANVMKFEFSERQFNGTLKQVYCNEPLSLLLNEKTGLKRSQTFKYLLQSFTNKAPASSTNELVFSQLDRIGDILQRLNLLKMLQSFGYVHGDLSLGNMLIGIEEHHSKKTYKPVMGDFDFFGKEGHKSFGGSKDKYPYWDEFANLEGLFLRTGDYRGFVELLGYLILPGYTSSDDVKIKKFDLLECLKKEVKKLPKKIYQEFFSQLGFDDLRTVDAKKLAKKLMLTINQAKTKLDDKQMAALRACWADLLGIVEIYHFVEDKKLQISTCYQQVKKELGVKKCTWENIQPLFEKYADKLTAELFYKELVGIKKGIEGMGSFSMEL